MTSEQIDLNRWATIGGGIGEEAIKNWTPEQRLTFRENLTLASQDPGKASTIVGILSEKMKAGKEHMSLGFQEDITQYVVEIFGFPA